MWIKKIFYKETKRSIVGEYRLLIIDQYLCYNTVEFISFRKEYSIITLYMPPIFWSSAFMLGFFIGINPTAGRTRYYLRYMPMT